MKVGRGTGVRATISAGVRNWPSIVATWQPASAAEQRPGGDVVRRLAQERAGYEPSRGHERLLAAGAAEVAEPARQRPRVDGPQRVGADADVVLGVERVGVGRGEPFAVAPGAAPLVAQ